MLIKIIGINFQFERKEGIEPSNPKGLMPYFILKDAYNQYLLFLPLNCII